MRADKKFFKAINKRFAKKQNELRRQPGVMGDGNSVLAVPNADNFIYVTIGNKAVPVFNNRVDPQVGVKVWVGYAPEEPTLFQVLSTRSETPAGVETGFVGYAPAKRYEWNAVGGGQDPLHVHLRAFSPLKLGMSATGGMNVDLYRGYIYSGTEYLSIARQDVDLTAQIPATTGKAALVLITIDNTGATIQTKGSEVDIDVLALTDLPAIPADTVFVCGAVRVYYGQTLVQEGRTNTDFVDLRFPGKGGTSGGGVASVTGDGVNNTDPANPVLTYPTPADIGAAVADTAKLIVFADSPYTILSTDNTLICDTSGGSITLYAPATSGGARRITVEKLTATNLVTVNVDHVDGSIVNGASAYVLNNQYEAVTILDYAVGTWITPSRFVNGVMLTSANIEDSIVDGHTTIAPSGNAVFDALALKEAIANKDASGGYAGLTLFKINFKNVANTFTSFFTNTNTAARTYTFKDADGTVAFTSDITGTNSGTNTGDVSLAGTPNYITIVGQVITRALIGLSHMADVATATVFYRKTAGTGAPEVQTLATLKTDLGLTGTNSGDQTLGSLGAEATANKDASGGYAGLTLFKINFKNVANTFTSFFTNSNTAARTYTFKDADGTVAFTSDITGTNSGTNTGDQTITLTGDVTGSGTGSFAATIAAAAVTLAKMANMATASVFYRKTAGSGAPEVQTLATLKTDLGLTGTNSGDQTITLTGDVTGSGTGSFAATIAAAAVTLAKMANMATASVFYRKTAGTGAPEVQTLATLAADIFPAWTSYTPTFTQTATITKTIRYAKYLQIGKMVWAQVNLLASSAGTAGAAIQVGLPVTAATNAAYQTFGEAFFNDISVPTSYVLAAYPATTSVLDFLHDTSGNGVFGTTPGVTVATGDNISFSIFYEAA